ncbi:hypothetical protein BpHYR1_008226 [Brachionus plicatilis]|uniref:Uncharacterized protein n=1 Tax=Brachionus plicatilis TaxID=10195 RepID=A0A3M7RM13_BRAPC|nr:hypothetical protein BpHYR1_008226 [Brachionus plicatilis]
MKSTFLKNMHTLFTVVFLSLSIGLSLSLPKESISTESNDTAVNCTFSKNVLNCQYQVESVECDAFSNIVNLTVLPLQIFGMGALDNDSVSNSESELHRVSVQQNLLGDSQDLDLFGLLVINNLNTRKVRQPFGSNPNTWSPSSYSNNGGYGGYGSKQINCHLCIHFNIGSTRLGEPKLTFYWNNSCFRCLAAAKFGRSERGQYNAANLDRKAGRPNQRRTAKCMASPKKEATLAVRQNQRNEKFSNIT